MNATPVKGAIPAQRYKPFTVVLELPRRQGDELAEVAARTSIEQRLINVALLTETDTAKGEYALSMPRSLFSSVTGLMLGETNEKPATNLICMILRDQMALSNSNVPQVIHPDDIPF